MTQPGEVVGCEDGYATDFEQYALGYSAFSAGLLATNPPNTGLPVDDPHHDWGAVGGGGFAPALTEVELANDPTAPSGGSNVLKVTFTGNQSFGGGYAYQPIGTVEVGKVYNVTVSLRAVTPWPTENGEVVASIVGTGIGYSTGFFIRDGSWNSQVFSFTAPTTAAVEVRIAFAYWSYTHGPHSVYCDVIGVCHGELGVPNPGSGGGGGGGGDEEVPPPDPVTGTRTYGIFDIPSTGAGSWNSTVKRIYPGNLGVIAQAASAGIKLFMTMGYQRTPAITNADGTFSYTKWKAAVDALASNTTVSDAITAGTIPMHYLIDEPTAAGTWGGVPVGIATLQRMAQYSKSIWPTLKTVVRSPATSYSQQIAGLDYFWAQFHLRRGMSAAAYRDANIAAADAIGSRTVIGMNVIDFGGTGSGSGRIARWASAADYRAYGNILAASSETVAFSCWAYRADWYNQTGMAAAVLEVGNTYKSYDP